MRKKILIFIPDGVGLRNFLYSNFYELAIKEFDIILWNATSYDLTNEGYNEIKIINKKINFLTDYLKTAKINIELNLNTKKSNNYIYQKYKFPFNKKTFKAKLKSEFIFLLITIFNSNRGLKIINYLINILETNTVNFKNSIKTLKIENPEIVFCTNQRHTIAIAPILAAKKLKIPTITFIFSWDNLPKATLMLDTNYYLVWSTFMKKQLIYYYPNIESNKIKITGTPQFEKHTNNKLIIEKSTFFKKYNLDLNKQYICFSGDDVTTSPNDQLYLKDIAENVTKLNDNGYNIGIIFRKCPVDNSKRYNSIIESFKEIIIPIEPLWSSNSDKWDTIYPQKEDLNLLINIIYHTEYVINVGSSMVFDYITNNKLCFYLNYEIENKFDEKHSITKLYDFIHFKSMVENNSVIWLNNYEEIYEKLVIGFDKSKNNKILKNANDWFKIINEHPFENASQRIINVFNEIIINKEL